MLVEVSIVASKFLQYTTKPVERHVGYLFSYKHNRKKLKTEADILIGIKDTLKESIARDEANGKVIRPDTMKLLKRMEDIIGQYEQDTGQYEQANRDANTKCLLRCCPNPAVHYQLSKKSKKLLKLLMKLLMELYKEDLTNISFPVPVPHMSKASTGDNKAFESRSAILQEIINELANPETLRIGVHGTQGIGKTTFAQEIYRRAKNEEEKDRLFDDVAMVLNLNENPDTQIIQKEIAEMLGLAFSENHDSRLRAQCLTNRIKGHKVLIILDGILNEIDLENLGISSMPTCKVLLTSTSREVLSTIMGIEKDFKLTALTEDESWQLFERTVGDRVVADRSIQSEAKRVAKTCGGFPGLIVKLGRIMKNRTTLPAWRDALKHMETFDHITPIDSWTAIEYRVKILEWSYVDYEIHSPAQVGLIMENESGLLQPFLDSKVELPNITRLVIRNCRSTFLLIPSVARALVQLKRLEIHDCDIMEEIVETQEVGNEITGKMFSKLNYLKIIDLPRLRRFCLGSNIEFPSLEELQIKGCKEMENFIHDPSSENVTGYKVNEVSTSKNLQIAEQCFLFDEKVRIPKVKKLFLHGFDKLTRIWRSQLVARNSFGSVKELEVRGCPRLTEIFPPRDNFLVNLTLMNVERCHCLKTIFPSSVARYDLKLLEKMFVKNCAEMEEIVSNENETKAVQQLVFPKLVLLWFKDAPKLKGFYQGRHTKLIWPALRDFRIVGCPQLTDDICQTTFNRVPTKAFSHRGWT
ncbi:probable disease resistance protein At1g12290 [Argentina anserina]|uniref:probable disease resistance protein At1g12290 n=1 Tax=Argentina anserina TaxID=57926 RepID=UPI0021764650|nr:probable disease resistance protein At1g12290 [Potentilla anserina]